jgi:hypothetical protein
LHAVAGPVESCSVEHAVNIVRFHETINGRPYVIEVLPIDRDRWRAQIVRKAGGTTALMPFYGATPDEAAQQLSEWLARVAANRS